MRNVVDIIRNTDIGKKYTSENEGYQREINDFALLKLDFSLDFIDDNIKPACLPKSADIGVDIGLDYTNDRCFASGWGTIQSGMFS